eukprot:1160222-Pelagomonas_calceolata.AAC.8
MAPGPYLECKQCQKKISEIMRPQRLGPGGKGRPAEEEGGYDWGSPQAAQAVKQLQVGSRGASSGVLKTNEASEGGGYGWGSPQAAQAAKQLRVGYFSGGFRSGVYEKRRSVACIWLEARLSLGTRGCCPEGCMGRSSSCRDSFPNLCWGAQGGIVPWLTGLSYRHIGFMDICNPKVHAHIHIRVADICKASMVL